MDVFGRAGACDARFLARLCVGFSLLVAAPAATAACRVTDFTNRPLSSLNELQRLSFVSQMTQTEFAKMKVVQASSPDFYAPIAQSATLIEARRRAKDKIDGLNIENSDDFVQIWSSDFLNDDQIQRMTTCSSERSPGVTFAGRPDGAGKFNLTLAHLTPVGVEKITLRLVASYNIANIAAFQAALKALGPADNFKAQTFPLRLADPKERAVVIVRAGYETPTAIYIPVYPTQSVGP